MGLPDGDFAAVLARAREAWPTLDVDAAAFAAHLGGLPVSQQLEVGDLYLAFAAASGAPAALARVDALLSELRPALAKLGLARSDQDEALQMVRTELLASQPPRILSYGGRGSLQGWLRSVAVRKGLRLIQNTPRHEPLDDRMGGSVSDDIEIGYLKKTYGEAFHRAFRVAICEQPAAERLLLKQRFRHQLGVVELGALYGVNAGTISRRVAAACKALSDATHAIMMRDLGIGRTDVSSVLRLIESQLEITLSSFDNAQPTSEP